MQDVAAAGPMRNPGSPPMLWLLRRRTTRAPGCAESLCLTESTFHRSFRASPGLWRAGKLPTRWIRIHSMRRSVTRKSDSNLEMERSEADIIVIDATTGSTPPRAT